MLPFDWLSIGFIFGFGVAVMLAIWAAPKEKEKAVTPVSPERKTPSAADGWHHWLDSRPPDAYIEIMRREWTESSLLYPSDIPPSFNVYGLYWRLFTPQQIKSAPQP